VLLLSLALLLAGPVFAAEALSVDVQYDKTGDGIVDSSDWKKMNNEEKAAYARASMLALGQDPDALLNDGKTLAGQYLDGLKSVYEK